MAGLSQGTYSFALLMINKRTRTTAGSGALSGFAQGIGHSLACLGPLLFGLLHDLSGSWVTSFILLGGWLLTLTAGLRLAAAVVPGTLLEERMRQSLEPASVVSPRSSCSLRFSSSAGADCDRPVPVSFCVGDLTKVPRIESRPELNDRWLCLAPFFRR